MPEGLSVSEVGKEIAEHRPKEDTATRPKSEEHSTRVLTIVEAILLAVVAVLAAYSGFASAKWGTESSLTLAKAATVRNFASRAQLQGLETKNFDASTFNAWFSAYVAGNTAAMTVAEHRFRPQFDVAFNAWIATDPFTNPSAPKGPTYMPEYIQPGHAETTRLDNEADDLYSEGLNGWSELRPLCPDHRLPGHGALPGRHFRALSAPKRPHRLGRGGRRDPRDLHHLVAHDAPTSALSTVAPAQLPTGDFRAAATSVEIRERYSSVSDRRKASDRVQVAGTQVRRIPETCRQTGPMT